MHNAHAIHIHSDNPQDKCYVKDTVHPYPTDGRRKYHAVAGILHTD